MRNNILHPGGSELTYEIRNIVQIGMKLTKFFDEIIWENIGDPIIKGHKVPDRIKEIISGLTFDNDSYCYCPTKGIEETRIFLANLNNKKGGAQITKSDIIFFNGLGDAISTVYHYLKKESRVIGNSPAYPTHSSAEAAHASDHHITFKMDPNNGWLPDLDYLHNMIRYNPSISGILLVSPDNPTGAVYTKEYLKKIVDIAKEYDLFIIVDEIYQNIIFSDTVFTSLAEVIDDVPAICMKGISKEYPWPGGRCGWIEVYNKHKDIMFAKYIDTIKKAKMLEVCSTTLPQKSIPIVMSDPRYIGHLKQLSKEYEHKANIAYNIFKDIDGLIVTRPNGAFYFSLVFKKGALNNKQTLNIGPEKQNIIENELLNCNLDKRFVIYLLAKYGICVVPLTGFSSNLQGFRMTLLEPNIEKFKSICELIKKGVMEYLSS